MRFILFLLLGSPSEGVTHVEAGENPATGPVFVDSFEGPEFNSERWISATNGEGSQVVLKNGRVTCSLAKGKKATLVPEFARLSSHGLWMLEGDFDVSVNYRIVSLRGFKGRRGDLTAELAVYRPGYKDGFLVARSNKPKNRSVYGTASQTAGIWQNRAADTEANAGQLRLVREGKVLTAYAGVKGELRQLQSVEAIWGEAPVIALFGVGRNQVTTEVSVEFDEFVVAKGRLGSWLSEPGRGGAMAKHRERGCVATNGGNAVVLVGLVMLLFFGNRYRRSTRLDRRY